MTRRKPPQYWCNLTPSKRDGDPRELKVAYLYLASDARIYITGSDIVVDGGYTCRWRTERDPSDTIMLATM